MNLENLNEEIFDKYIYDDEQKAVVMFSRKTCTVCKDVKSLLEKVSENYDDELRVYYVEAEQEKNLFKRFSLKGVPQILFFNEGQYSGKIAGNVSSYDIEEKIKDVFYESK